MKIQLLQVTATSDFQQTMQPNANFEETIMSVLQKNVQQREENEELRELSFVEMVALEHQAKIAFRQGDLINYERYMKQISGYKGLIDQAVQQAVATEEVHGNGLHESGGMFPKDAPQAIKDFEQDLSMRERMLLFAQVAVQDIMVNAYQDHNGHWRVRSRGEAGYVNIFEQPDFTYTKLVDKMLAYLEAGRHYLNEQEYEERLAVINGLKAAAKGY